MDERRRDQLRKISVALRRTKQSAETHSVPVLQRKIAEEKARADREAQLARTDELTEAPNRRLAKEVLAEIVATIRRDAEHERRGGKRGLGLALVDITSFNDVNNTLGHPEGDEYLRAVTQLLRKQVRETDFLARWGGDEFLLVMPVFSQDELEAILHDSRVDLEGRQIPGILESTNASLREYLERGYARQGLSFPETGDIPGQLVAGLSFFSPEQILSFPSAEEMSGALIDEADRQLYVFKGRREG